MGPFFRNNKSCFAETVSIQYQRMFYDKNRTPPFPTPQFKMFKPWIHRRRIKTEGKGKVVVSVRGEEFIQFLAVLAVLHRVILNNTVGWIASWWFERKGWIHSILHNRPIGKTACASRSWKYSSITRFFQIIETGRAYRLID